jgi:hypothetical protein
MAFVMAKQLACSLMRASCWVMRGSEEMRQGGTTVMCVCVCVWLLSRGLRELGVWLPPCSGVAPNLYRKSRR